MSERLDPLTLRVAASRVESARVPHHHQRCNCVVCARAAELCADLAAEFRTQAIRAEQAALTGPTAELPAVGTA